MAAREIVTLKDNGSIPYLTPPEVTTNDEVIRKLKCFHGCTDDIAGIFYFPNGCVCNPTKIQALCYYHMRRADSNRYGDIDMHTLVAFGDNEFM